MCQVVHRRTGTVGNAEAAGAGSRATHGANRSPVVGAHRVNAAEGYRGSGGWSVSQSKMCQSTCHNDRRPFAQASGEQLGAPRSPGFQPAQWGRVEAAHGNAATAPYS